MRIAFDAKRYFHNATGLGRYSQELINGLVERYPDNAYFMCSPSSGTPPQNAKVIQPMMNNKLVARYWRSIGVVRDLLKHKIELYHGLSNEMPFGLRAARIRRVVSIHDLIFLRYPDMYNRGDRWIYERKVNYAAINADAVIATSKQTADDIAFFYPVRPERLHVVYQSVSMPPVNSGLVKSVRSKYKLPDQCFLYVGRIEERKNLLGILDALRMIPHKSFHLAVVGRAHAPYLRRCMQFIRQHKLEDRVVFHQEVSREELAGFYNHSIALLYPSYFEGFGIPIVEAQSCGTAVITSEGGCFGETAGEAALFVNPSESAQLAEAMSVVAEDAALRRKLVDRGAINAQRFTREKFTDGVYDVYKNLLG